MFTLLNELHFWTFKSEIVIRDTDFGCFSYHEKRNQLEHEFQIGKKSYCEKRGIVWCPSNKRPAKIRDAIRELEECLESSIVIYSQWKEPDCLVIILNSGLLISLKINLLTGDLDHIHFDRHLLSKLSSHHVSDVAVGGSEAVFALEGNSILAVHFAKSALKSSSKHWVTIDSKFSDLISSSNQSKSHRLRISSNCTSDKLAIWWEKTGDVWDQMTNLTYPPIHIYHFTNLKPEPTCRLSSESQPLLVVFSQFRPTILHIIVQIISKRGDVWLGWCQMDISSLQGDGGVSVQPHRSIPLTSRVISTCLSPAEDKILIACSDSTLTVADYSYDCVVNNKTTFDDVRVVCWHPDSCIIVAGNNKALLEFFDSSLSPIKAVFNTHQLSHQVHLDLSVYFRHEPNLVSICWNKKPTSCNSTIQIDAFLFLHFDKGPLGVLKLIGGSRPGFSVDTVICNYLHSDVGASRAISLLSTLSWDSSGSVALSSLQSVVNHLLTKPLTRQIHSLLDEAIGCYYDSRKSISRHTCMEFNDSVTDMRRKIFHHLLRYQVYDSALKLAVDLGHYDLLMDVHNQAKANSLNQLASSALEKAEQISEYSSSRSHSSASSYGSSCSCCSKSSCSQCHDDDQTKHNKCDKTENNNTASATSEATQGSACETPQLQYHTLEDTKLEKEKLKAVENHIPPPVKQKVQFDLSTKCDKNSEIRINGHVPTPESDQPETNENKEAQEKIIFNEIDKSCKVDYFSGRKQYIINEYCTSSKDQLIIEEHINQIHQEFDNCVRIEINEELQESNVDGSDIVETCVDDDSEMNVENDQDSGRVSAEYDRDCLSITPDIKGISDSSVFTANDDSSYDNPNMSFETLNISYLPNTNLESNSKTCESKPESTVTKSTSYDSNPKSLHPIPDSYGLKTLEQKTYEPCYSDQLHTVNGNIVPVNGEKSNSASRNEEIKTKNIESQNIVKEKPEVLRSSLWGRDRVSVRNVVGDHWSGSLVRVSKNLKLSSKPISNQTLPQKWRDARKNEVTAGNKHDWKEVLNENRSTINDALRDSRNEKFQSTDISEKRDSRKSQTGDNQEWREYQTHNSVENKDSSWTNAYTLYPQQASHLASQNHLKTKPEQWVETGKVKTMYELQREVLPERFLKKETLQSNSRHQENSFHPNEVHQTNSFHPNEVHQTNSFHQKQINHNWMEPPRRDTLPSQVRWSEPSTSVYNRLTSPNDHLYERVPHHSGTKKNQTNQGPIVREFNGPDSAQNNKSNRWIDPSYLISKGIWSDRPPELPSTRPRGRPQNLPTNRLHKPPDGGPPPYSPHPSPYDLVDNLRIEIQNDTTKNISYDLPPPRPSLPRNLDLPPPRPNFHSIHSPDLPPMRSPDVPPARVAPNLWINPQGDENTRVFWPKPYLGPRDRPPPPPPPRPKVQFSDNVTHITFPGEQTEGNINTVGLPDTDSSGYTMQDIGLPESNLPDYSIHQGIGSIAPDVSAYSLQHIGLPETDLSGYVNDDGLSGYRRSIPVETDCPLSLPHQDSNSQSEESTKVKVVHFGLV